jgi:hypothetical protein
MIVAGPKVVEWLTERLDGADFYRIYAAAGVVRGDGILVGAGVLHNWSECDMELSYYGRLTAGIVRVLRAEAIRSGVLRVTLRTARCNPLRRSVQKFGFAYEGIQRRLYGPKKSDDAIMYGLMLRKPR